MGLPKTENRKILDKLNFDALLKNYSLDELADILGVTKTIIHTASSDYYTKKKKINDILSNPKFVISEEDLKIPEGIWINSEERKFLKAFRNEC